jgi:spore germination protein KA/spore germination protein
VELIREALIRVPSKIGTAIGIVGAIIIGNAATAAGIFDALVLILVSASLLASFAMPDYASMHPIRLLKFFLIFLTGILGFYGFVLGLSAILTNLVSMDSFGIPYLAPFAPFNRYDAKRAFLFSRKTSGLRMRFMKTQDDTRSRKGHEVKRKLNKNK